MTKVTRILAVSLLGLFSTHPYATQLVLQQGANGYTGTEDSQIKGGNPNDNLSMGNEYAVTNCND